MERALVGRAQGDPLPDAVPGSARCRQRITPVATTALVGTPAQVVEQIRAFVELGVDYFMVCVPRFPNMTTLELLIDDVIPVLNATDGDTMQPQA